MCGGCGGHTAVIAWWLGAHSVPPCTRVGNTAVCVKESLLGSIPRTSASNTCCCWCARIGCTLHFNRLLFLLLLLRVSDPMLLLQEQKPIIWASEYSKYKRQQAQQQQEGKKK